MSPFPRQSAMHQTFDDAPPFTAQRPQALAALKITRPWINPRPAAPSPEALFTVRRPEAMMAPQFAKPSSPRLSSS
jgi:hypothetical protein